MCTALAVSAALCALPAFAQDPVIGFSGDDPEMSAAIAEARTQLDVVLGQLVSPEGEIHPALNLKASLPVTQLDVEVEVIWVEALSLTEDGRFTGQLANDPSFMPGFSLGDTVTFARDQVADWSVLSTDGRMYGHYTTRVLLDDLPAAEAAQIRDLLSPDPFPEVWR